MIRLVGGLFLCCLGLRTATARAATAATGRSGRGLVAVYGSTFALTLTNPSTILSFAAVFAGFGLAERAGDRWSAVQLVLGVVLGSALWWLMLSGGVGLFRRSVTPGRLRWINRLSGASLVGFGLTAVVGLV